jgi:hypothetical protein
MTCPPPKIDKGGFFPNDMLILLGILDILGIIFITLSINFSILNFIAWAFMGYFIIKTIVFFSNWASWLDAILLFFLFLGLMGLSTNNLLIGISLVWFIQKGILSFF